MSYCKEILWEIRRELRDFLLDSQNKTEEFSTWAIAFRRFFLNSAILLNLPKITNSISEFFRRSGRKFIDQLLWARRKNTFLVTEDSSRIELANSWLVLGMSSVFGLTCSCSCSEPSGLGAGDFEGNARRKHAWERGELCS